MVRGLRPHDLAGKAGEIAAELEERLERGEYRFGETLSIYALARQFDASRQPVATAVLYLRSVGYLEVIPQVGCRVVSPSDQEVQDFYVLFAQTESVVARFAAERFEADEGERLIGLAEQLAVQPFESREDRARMADAVSIFHDHLGAMARSPNLVDRISNQRRLFRFYLSQGRPAAMASTTTLERINRHRITFARCVSERNIAGIPLAMDAYILDALDDWARIV